ncbi:ADP-ribosylglycohydrolase family protein, partial [Hungatella effluvii]
SDYEFDETCQGTVPQAIVAFLESTDFEDAIRNAVSLGGDSDTLAAITGSIAGAYYGIPDDMILRAFQYLDEYLSSKIEFY